MRSEDIRLDTINIKDERFRISYYSDLFALIHSISEIGLIHPPVITYREGDAIIVTGWKRVLACQSLDLPSIPCFVFEGQDDFEAFRLGLEENLAFRPFTLLEKAQILSRLIQLGIPEKGVVKDHLFRLEIPQTLNHLDTYLRIAALDPETKAAIHSKNMVFPVVQLLTEYSEEERRLLLFFLHPLGQNKRRELLQNLLEIAKRDRIPIQNILTGEDVHGIASDQNLSPLQKAEEIRNLIQRKRYPTLSTWKDMFKSHKKDLEWPNDIKIEPSPFFEGEEFTVHFTFKDLDEYRKKLTKLNQMASDEKISRLLKFSPEKKDE
ncbi:MAG: ParB N-terminal domain-containing protein [Candidatus Aminicenantaceae bacterium]